MIVIAVLLADIIVLVIKKIIKLFLSLDLIWYVKRLMYIVQLHPQENILFCA